VESQVKSKLKAKEVYGLEIVRDIPGQLVGLIHQGAASAVPFPYSEVERGERREAGEAGEREERKERNGLQLIIFV
jgi:hypothetical protein